MKAILSLILFSCLLLPAKAQVNSYTKEWAKIAAFEKKGLTRSAQEEVKKVYEMAIRSGNEAQQVKAIMYLLKFRNIREEDNIEKNVSYLDSMIASSKTPVRNILLSMQAELLNTYKEYNRYKFYNRTALVEELSSDISTWSLQKLHQQIKALYTASLQDRNQLRSIPLTGLEDIIQKGKATRQFRPTLYDLLAHRALDYFMNDENITTPGYKFILNDPVIFSPAKKFIQSKFHSRDTSSNYFQALLLLQDILTFHANDGKPDALIDADLKRLAFMYEHAAIEGKDDLYEKALVALQNEYPLNPLVARAALLQASLHLAKGEQYDPFSNPTVQFEKMKAKAMLETIVSKFPGSEGGIQAANQLATLIMPALEFETEKINIPRQPFRSLVKYKNFKTLYLRIIRTSRDEAMALSEREFGKTWSDILKKPALKEWKVDLPDQKDLQQHATEIRIDALEPGIYFILTSIDPSFSMTRNIMGRQLVYVSSISYMINNKNEMYVLDRDLGTPLVNAGVQIWQSGYNYTTRKNEQSKKEKYVTDQNGLIRLVKQPDRYNQFYQVTYKNEELFTDEPVYDRYYNNIERPAQKKTFFFTDRSIYRPGQSMSFKGIVVSTEKNTSRTSVMPQFKTTLILLDANHQKIARLQMTTNEYGSYNGRFQLPGGTLNGQFMIQDSLTKSTQYFSVEEYKRPKFQVEISKPAGTYRVNDSITVKGNAKAYAGNAIDGARLVYRVTRKVRYPFWWSSYKIWPPYGRQAEMEIANGVLTTDAIGNFEIRFKAIPDEKADKKGQPVFYYEINADVTAIDGETRSATNLVAVAYQALQLNINGPENLHRDSLQTISFTSTNINGIFEAKKIHVSIQKLQSPSRVLRSRYWERPDQHTMSREEFERLFPFDVYADEDQQQAWAIENVTWQDSITTKESGKWSYPGSRPEPGWYKITVTAKDKFGDTARSEKFILLTTPGISNPTQAASLNIHTVLAEPGQVTGYDITTSFPKAWLIHTITRMNGKTLTSYPVISANNSFNNNITVSEEDRGGISLEYAFIRHNRVYQGRQLISIPWTNKELRLSYETFRDKVLPGSEEKWKVRISGSKKEQVAAEALISMYDASLDQFKPHAWNSLQSLWPLNTATIFWTTPGFQSVAAMIMPVIPINYKEELQRTYDNLLSIGWNMSGYGYGRVMYDRLGNDEMAPVLQGTVAGVAVTRDAAATEKSEGAKYKGAKISVTSETDTTLAVPSSSGFNVQARKNFQETAFFYPVLSTNAMGDIEFNFTIPEALTQWKLMTIAHTKELASVYGTNQVITQKPLMVQPNAPRFLREGDKLELTAKISNTSDREIRGTAQLELFDALSNKPVDNLFKNFAPVLNFTVSQAQSVAVTFKTEIPIDFGSALLYRIKAISTDGSFSDGEEAALPVLTNRMLVTETLPLDMKGNGSKTFSFPKLLNSNNSGSLAHHALTVEYTRNPAWYAVQALPYLMEFPYECSEQQFNRFYANALAASISNSIPAIRAIFEKWKITDTAALLSNLQKNPELKSALLEETPWVMEAKNESLQKKNIALLFDMVRLANEKQASFARLKQMQSPNGGFSWFQGGPDDRYITQYIVTGIGHLIKLKALSEADQRMVKPMLDKALPYLDARLKDEYEKLLTSRADMKKNHLSMMAIQYLYMHSFFANQAVRSEAASAYKYYKGQAKTYWLQNNKYLQAMIALALYRDGDATAAKAIVRSLEENAIYKEEMGMYWRDLASGGYYWHQAPIESQSLMIELFSETAQDQNKVNELKRWLLKQKQTTQWRTTRATAEACYALLLTGENWLADDKQVTIKLGNLAIASNSGTGEAGSGYIRKVIPAASVQQGMGNISVKVESNGPGSPSWGAVYWQYFEDLDKISSASGSVKLQKKLFVEINSDRGPVLREIRQGDRLNVGDKIKVRLEVKVDRDMEYMHLKDSRAAGMEPVNVLSRYKYQGGVGYYESTRDASTNFFFGWLPRGSYVFEYPLFITHQGNFSNGIATLQSMYAPEFSSHSEGVRISVE